MHTNLSESKLSTMKKIIFLIALFPSILLADDFKMCREIASEINSSTPMNIDETTRLVNAKCISNSKKGKKVKLKYSYKILDGRVSKKDIQARRTEELNKWCTKPDLNFKLNTFDIEYSHSYMSDKYISSINLTIKDCK